MKDIMPAILSVVLSYAISTFGLNMYLEKAGTNTSTSKEKVVAVRTKTETPVTKKAEVPKKTVAKTPKKVEKTISVDTENIQKSYKNWYAYNKKNIDLMSSFTAMDDSGKKIGKELFLNLLRTGVYIPVKTEKPYHYQLVEINSDADAKIKKTIRSAAKIAVKYHNMEGKKLPEYDFVDLNGVSYNKEDTEGKLLVLKCWFITCKVCVEEFPELNALVDRYKGEDVEFVSLAFDKGDKLTEFLKTKPFKYAVVPEQKDYMNKKLRVKQYPTHVIVDTDGTILKMVNNVHSLIHELDKITGKDNS